MLAAGIFQSLCFIIIMCLIASFCPVFCAGEGEGWKCEGAESGG